ncbi:hypothetical protein THRCLA_07070 [Thraustotheca clavata]|uniref:Uncharacterized protein n=1 Tax=Thraustotheca clavata TaxID=74557 RepID=A0A1V9ZGU9_9STRA|nr:hypothetical protein THRCLA_07070 [Thraustotheca clavata]
MQHQHSDGVRLPLTSLIALTPTSVDVPMKRGKQKAAVRSHSEPGQDEKNKASPKLEQIVIPFDDWFIMPIYVCPTHATKDGLSESYRHKGSWTKRELIRIEQKMMRAAPASSITWAVPYTYYITVNNVSHQFKCQWSEYREYQRTVLADEKLAPLYTEAVHSRYIEETFKGSVLRAVSSLERMSEEVKNCLHAISQVDALVAEKSYQDLVGCPANKLLHEELLRSLEKDTKQEPSPKKGGLPPVTNSFDEQEDDASETTDTFDELQECLCDVFCEAFSIFGEHIYSHGTHDFNPNRTARDGRVEEYLCMDMMVTRSTLSLYTDCLFTLDKEKLTSSTSYAQCTVYGFGCRPLFQVKRTSKTKWTLADNSHGALMTMQLKRYGANQPMIVISRIVPSNNGHARTEECIGMFRKSWRRGYQFILMSDVVTQGKITTAFAFSNTVIHNQHRYLVGSVVSGQDQGDLIVTATLSIPENTFCKQRLHITDSSDLLLQIALACSYDFLASARPFYRMDYHY